MTNFYNAFISYGRKDSKAFASKLLARLQEQGFKVWFDFNNIPLGVDFQKQINDGIEKAHTFLFIISPHAVNSLYCFKEIELAIKYNKRIIPLLHVEEISQETWQQRNPRGTDLEWEGYKAQGKHTIFQNMHSTISKINWVYFREGLEDFDNSLADLIDLFRERADYVERHTQLLVKALEWKRHQKKTCYLLVGEEKQQAEAWLKIRFKDEQPPCTPTDLHGEHITESIKNGNNLMTEVFLSYADEDRAIAEKICNSLRREGITVWKNITDIQTGEEFQEAIDQGIERADNFVYLLSPDSLDSMYCQKELGVALSLNKRIIPLLVRETDLMQVPSALRDLQYIDLTDNQKEEDYQLDESELLRTLNQEAAYYNEHKILLVKAMKWVRQEKNPSILLRGYNLRSAETWLKVAQTRRKHRPTPLQAEFIAESLRQPPLESLDVFISYSRADSDLARKLNDNLQMQGKTTWFDQESIASGTDFQQEIYRGIRACDNFVFILSPRAVNSPYCKDEVEYAASLNKRFVTLLHQDINMNDLHPELAKVQWIDFNGERRDFQANFNQLVRTLDTDRQYLHSHTKWLQRALEWKHKNQSEDLLLRGSELIVAREWLHKTEKQQKKPGVTQLHKTFIEASQGASDKAREVEKCRQAEMLRLQEEKTKAQKEKTKEAQRRLAQQKFFLVAVSATLVVATVTSIVAIVTAILGKNAELKARNSELKAIASQLTTTSERLREKSGRFYGVSGLLAVESANIVMQQKRNSLQTDLALRNSLKLRSESSTPLHHNDEVWAVSFSRDNRWVATASHDNTARIWNAQTGEQIARLDHNGPVVAVSLSRDNRWVATTSLDKTARIWNAQTGEQIARLDHDDEVYAVSFSRDNHWVATASKDHTARIWNAQTGKQIARLNHDDLVVAVSFSRDNRWVATASHDNTARIWNAQTGEPIARLDHDNEVYAVSFSRDNRWVATASHDNTARIWNAQTGEPIARFDHDGPVVAVSFSSDNRWVATASWDHTARIWNAQTGEPIARLDHDDLVVAISFSRDNRWMATASYDNTARIWNAQTGEPIARLDHDGSVRAVSFSGDNRWLATASYDNTARIWNAQTREPIARLDHDDEVYAVSFSEDNRWVATASYDNTARIWNAQTREPIAHLAHDGPVVAVSFSRDNRWVATASYDNTAQIWNAQTGEPIARLDHDDIVYAVSFSSNNRWVATASHNNTAQIWNAQTGEPIARLDHDDIVYAVSFSRDNRWVATASYDNTAQIWNAQTGEPIARLNHNDIVYAVSFSRDNRWVATASRDNTARIWNAQTGEPIAHLDHGSSVNAVSFSRDNRWVATASHDNTARIWNAQTGEPIARLDHDDRVRAVSFSRDNRWVATASHDGTARIWWVSLEDLTSQLCYRLTRNLTADDWQKYLNSPLPNYRRTCPQHPVHPSVLREAMKLAKTGHKEDRRTALAIFRRAQKLQPDIDLDPTTQTKDSDAKALVQKLAAPVQ